MLLRKKPMFGANIQPACTYCEFGQKAADPRMILCAKKGVVSPYYHCKKFSYDPLRRVPRRKKRTPARAPDHQGSPAGVLFCLSVTANYKVSPSLACSSVSSCSGVWLTKLT